jgi:hypothetical protein
MWRWAWRILVTISLLLLLATVGMWVRAQWGSDGLGYERVDGGGAEGPAVRVVWWTAWRGGLAFWRAHYPVAPHGVAAVRAFVADPVEGPGVRVWHHPPASEALLPPPPSYTTRGGIAGGFGWRWWTIAAPPGQSFIWRSGPHIIAIARMTRTGLSAPWWFLALLFALAPVHALWTWRRERGGPAHACVGCGYDLRATADAGGPFLATCPECGRATGQL